MDKKYVVVIKADDVRIIPSALPIVAVRIAEGEAEGTFNSVSWQVYKTK